MKKLSKIKAGIILGTSLITNTMLFSSCQNQNTIQQNSNIEQSNEQDKNIFFTENLNDKHSDFQICKINITDITQPQINAQFKQYLNNLVNEFEDSLTDTETKKYFNSTLRCLNRVNYTDNLNQAIETVYNYDCANFFVGLIRAIPLTDDNIGLEKRKKLCYLLEIMLNEAYGKAISTPTDAMINKYNANVSHATRPLAKYGLVSLNSDIKNGNYSEIINTFKQLSNEAITNINDNMGTQITDKHVAQMFNITSTAKSLKAMQDVSSTQNQQKANLKLFYKLENAIPDEWNLLEFPNSESFELER